MEMELDLILNWASFKFFVEVIGTEGLRNSKKSMSKLNQKFHQKKKNLKSK
jgi:hypothetical protein